MKLGICSCLLLRIGTSLVILFSFLDLCFLTPVCSQLWVVHNPSSVHGVRTYVLVWKQGEQTDTHMCTCIQTDPLQRQTDRQTI